MGFAATLYLKLFPAPSVSETVIIVLPEVEPAADVTVKLLFVTVFFYTQEAVISRNISADKYIAAMCDLSLLKFVFV